MCFSHKFDWCGCTSSTASETWFHDSGPCLDICDTHDYDRFYLDLGDRGVYDDGDDDGHHEEFLRIDEILVIMMMAMMVMTCIMGIMLI